MTATLCASARSQGPPTSGNFSPHPAALGCMSAFLTLHLRLWLLESKWAPDPSSLFLSYGSGTVNECLHVVAGEKIETQDLKGSCFPIVRARNLHREEQNRYPKKQKAGETEDYLCSCLFSSFQFRSSRGPCSWTR